MKSLSVELRLKVVLVGQTWSNLFKPGQGFTSWPPGQPWFLQEYIFCLSKHCFLAISTAPPYRTGSKLATALLQKGNPYQGTWTLDNHMQDSQKGQLFRGQIPL